MLKIDFEPDAQPSPAHVNTALGPILETTKPYDCLDDPEDPVSGFERLVDLYLEQAWAAAKTPAPFPFLSFVGAMPDRPSIHAGGAPMKGLLSTFAERYAWILDRKNPGDGIVFTGLNDE